LHFRWVIPSSLSETSRCKRPSYQAGADMARVGLLTFSDGRDFVHADIKAFSLDVESRIAQALEAAGHEVIRAAEPIWTNMMASTEARRVADARPDLTIFNYAVWAFPH